MEKLKVDDAIRLFDFEGLASVVAYASIESHCRGTTYVYIFDSDGYTIASPYPEMIGRDPAMRVDSTGYFFGNDLLGATEEGKWIGHTFLLPSTQEMMRTASWVVRHEGMFFASGKYPEGIVGWP